MGREVARVGVEVDDQLAAGRGQSAPHRVALPQHRAEAGQQRGFLVDLGAERGGDLGGPVGGLRVDHEHLVDQPVEREQALHDRPDRVGHGARGQHHRDRLALALEQQLERELRVMEGADQGARTMASRGPCPDALSVGSRARERGRGRGRRGGARDRAGGRHDAAAGGPPPRPRRLARGGRDRGALVAPGGRARGRTARPRDRHDRHRERQVARLQPAGAGHARGRSVGARVLPLPDQGARPGPGAQAERARGALAAPRDLRRRHAARGAARDPRALEPDPHEPRHAPRGGAAQPPRLGRRAGEPRLDRGRRGARLPRRLRLARGQRAAPAAAPCARLRRRAALRPDQRHDRQPAPARGEPHRARDAARRPRRRAARRATGGDVEPAARWTSSSASAPPR